LKKIWKSDSIRLKSGWAGSSTTPSTGSEQVNFTKKKKKVLGLEI
jgi:hypothetical protein